ncbi:hypothetical protein MLD38_007443 [Melastoma candidum]|uniref:Uncharacterized protein n=1 Tax=Melastoma candidum TaxID=119954 RepID=A0ACB9RRP1_9MYRT|nr:hypothetical protein MLD38_007443 [Melastoma candidum]
MISGSAHRFGPAFSDNRNPAVHEPSAFLPEKKPSRFSLLRLLLRKGSAVVSNRGMSPAGGGSDEDEDLSPSNSGYSSEDCLHSWKRTPASSAAFVTPRRVTMTPHHLRSRSGFAFCLSPLVRNNPGGNWKNKGEWRQGRRGIPRGMRRRCARTASRTSAEGSIGDDPLAQPVNCPTNRR